MTKQDQIKILLAQKQIIDNLISRLSAPKTKPGNPTKQTWVIFCDVPDQTGCGGCRDRYHCREIFNKPKET